MKTLFSVLIISALCLTDLYGQVKIPFNEPPIYSRERSGQQPTYSGNYADQGYLLVEKRTSSVTIISERNNEEKRFEFTEFKPVQGVGHYLSFGVSVEGSMFNFIPEDNLLLFGFKGNTMFAIELTNPQKNELLQEMRK